MRVGGRREAGEGGGRREAGEGRREAGAALIASVVSMASLRSLGRVGLLSLVGPLLLVDCSENEEPCVYQDVVTACS
jgi:hypothetical protein